MNDVKMMIAGRNILGVVNDAIDNGDLWASEETKRTNEYFDSSDNSAPSAATDGVKLPGLTNRLTLAIDLASATTWTFEVYGYNSDAGVWCQLEPVATEAVSAAISSATIQITVTADAFIAFEPGGVIDRIAFKHVSDGSGAKCYVLG